MERCYRCGSAQNLRDAISEKEIVKICDKCQFRENLPLIKKPSIEAFANDRPLSVQERLANMSGVPANPRAQREKMLAERKRREEEFRTRKEQDEELRKVADKSFRNKIESSNSEAPASGSSGMMRNFHWVIMRARRARHLTQRSLADMIHEPTAAIEMAERGVLPREHEALVKKIQQALKIQITKIPYDTYTKLPEKSSEAASEVSGEYSEMEGSDLSEKEKRWTIGDLLRIKKRVKVKDREKDESVSREEIDKILEENSRKQD